MTRQWERGERVCWPDDTVTLVGTVDSTMTAGVRSTVTMVRVDLDDGTRHVVPAALLSPASEGTPPLVELMAERFPQ